MVLHDFLGHVGEHCIGATECYDCHLGEKDRLGCEYVVESEYCCQYVIKIMGDAASQGAYGFHFLGLL